MHSDRSRAEVKSEVLAARASGELNAFVGEDSGSFYLSRQGAKHVRPFHRVAAESSDSVVRVRVTGRPAHASAVSFVRPASP